MRSPGLFETHAAATGPQTNSKQRHRITTAIAKHVRTKRSWEIEIVVDAAVARDPAACSLDASGVRVRGKIGKLKGPGQRWELLRFSIAHALDLDAVLRLVVIGEGDGLAVAAQHTAASALSEERQRGTAEER
jgi:hypothetical protein